MSESATHKKTKKRSPAYPSFPLAEAIQKIEVLYKGEDTHGTHPDAIAAYWKNTPTSSTFLKTISTLKQFGLLDDTGMGPKRQVSVSDLAVQILEGHEREVAVKAAAMAPKLHRELWDKYGGKLPPRDDSIRFYLINQREDTKFNKAYVDDFIAQFRATVSYAGLQENDKINGSNGEWSDGPPVDEEHEPSKDQMQEHRDNPKPAPAAKHGAAVSQSHAWGVMTVTQDFPLYTPSGKGALSVPAQMTVKDFELLKKQIENSLAVIEATAVKEASGQPLPQ